ncbi:MAG TPA: DNA polymerase III subunit alpha [Candidatus Sulfotelmatobacter sp.]|nr:DNA polymerase III subunit alpha [Candidatus Sulfotelmatobacter sp.]
MSAFVPLRVRSHGSLLYGTAAPEALIARALEQGYDSLALTDRDNLYLAIRFWRAAHTEGLKPLLGVELSARAAQGARGGAAAGTGPGALLLAIDRRGYANLCALITARMLDPEFDLVAGLAQFHAGLHLIVESPGLAASLQAAGVPAAFGAAPAGPGSGPRPRDGGLWLGIRGLPAERTRLAERLDAAIALGIPLVATGDVVAIEPRDHELHAIAVTAAAGELRERMPPAAFAAREAWLASPLEWTRRVRAVCGAAGRPEAATAALANNVALVARCRLELELGTPILPRAPLPDGMTGTAHLERLVTEGLRRRYGVRATGADAGSRRRYHDARPRLGEELEIIERMGFTDYFLLVAEIVGYARSKNIPTVGRGSGASSLVAYALGITNVDPMRYGLYFERFLHPARRDCPDLDIDLCWKRRDEVIEHVYDTYGHDRVAMICTHSTLGARSAFRETAKALGLSNPRVNALARRVPREMEPPYLDQLLATPDARFVDWREAPLPEALKLAERLSGAPRHLSVHSGGLVIADRELTYYVPLERAAKNLVVTQFEMRAIEALGLVKMDLLGNRCLSTLGECVELVTRRAAGAAEREADREGSAPRRSRTGMSGAGRGEGSRRPDGAGNRTSRSASGSAVPPTLLSLDTIPEDDPATAARLAAGDTLNCFQLESPAMRHLLRMLGCRTLDDTIAAVALVRPGPAESGMKTAYCRRRRGLEAVSCLHPRLEPVLSDTLGVMLYEEDVMRVAAALTGLPLAAGDELRRAIAAARGDEEFRALERGFVAQAARAGVDGATARAVWCELTRFAAYAFCKAHAAGYGVLGWQSAYLKTHFPVEYAVGILNHHAGMYPTWVHVEDLRRAGVGFLAPCVERSQWDATLEDAADPAPEGAAAESLDARPAAARVSARAVRVGLSRVFGLAETTGARILHARAERRFSNLADFLERVRPTPPEVESLILAGALDALGRSRPTLLLEARVSAPAVARLAPRTPVLVVPGGDELAPPPVAPAPVPSLPEFDRFERARGEARATGLWFSAHPLDSPELEAARRGAVACAELPRRVGERVALVGLTCAYRRVETRRGEPMLFATIADASGLAEGTLFTSAYRAWGPAARASVVRLEGRVEEALDAVTLNVERVIALDGSAPSPAPHAWRREQVAGRSAEGAAGLSPRETPRAPNGISAHRAAVRARARHPEVKT